jgi:very-short-patch-repair endonuclease
MPVGENKDFVSPKEFARHLRNHPTPAEKVLWQELRSTKTGYKFRRQLEIEGRFVDFCCTSRKVVIEIDGDSHDDKEDSDLARDRALAELGFKVLRSSNDEVLSEMRRVLEQISTICEGRPQWRY